jgi:hypothetical protein
MTSPRPADWPPSAPWPITPEAAQRIATGLAAACGEPSWARREADSRQAMRQLAEVACAAGRREVLDLLGLPRGTGPAWRREVQQIRLEAALWRAELVIRAVDAEPGP